MVSENGMEMPAIVGDATGGKVRRSWRDYLQMISSVAMSHTYDRNICFLNLFTTCM